MKIKQFDVLLVQFSPVEGCEQDGLRPAIALQSNALADKGPITFVGPLTSNINKMFSFETLVLPSPENGLTLPSKFLIRHIGSIDKKRIIKKIGSLEKKYHVKILKSIDIIFDLGQDFG